MIYEKNLPAGTPNPSYKIRAISDTGASENIAYDELLGAMVHEYLTYADLPNPGNVNNHYKVTQDPTAANNGYYHWNGTAYVKDSDTLDVAVNENAARIEIIEKPIVNSLKYNSIPEAYRNIYENPQLPNNGQSFDTSTYWQRNGFWNELTLVSDKIIDKITIPLYSLSPLTGDLRVKIFVNGVLFLDLTVDNADLIDSTIKGQFQPIILDKRYIMNEGDVVAVGWEMSVNEPLQLVYGSIVDPSGDFGLNKYVLVSSNGGVFNATEPPSSYSEGWAFPINFVSLQVYDSRNPEKYIKLAGIDNLDVERTTNVLNPATSINAKYLDSSGNLQPGTTAYWVSDFIEWGSESNIVLGLNGGAVIGAFTSLQYDSNKVPISGSYTGIGDYPVSIPKYTGAAYIRITYTDANQFNFGTVIQPFENYGFKINKTTDGDAVYFRPDPNIGKVDLTGILEPKRIYTVFNDIKGVGSDDLFNVRFNASTLYFDNLLKDIKEDLDINIEDNENEKLVIYSDEITVDKLSETKTVHFGGSSKYNDGTFSFIKKSVKETANKTQFPKIMVIGDSVTSGYLSQVGLEDETKSSRQYWSVIKEQFEKAKIDGGDVGTDYNCLMVGKNSSHTWDLTYGGVSNRPMSAFAEGYGGWQSASHLYWSRNWELPTSQGMFDLLGLGDGTGTDYGDTGDGELVRTTPEGKYTPKDTPAFIDYINTNLGASATNYSEAVALLDNLESNPENPFYDKATAVAKDVAFSFKAYYDRYKTLEQDGVTRLVVGSTAGTKVTDVNDYDVCVPTHFIIQHSHNDNDISWFADNMRKWTTQIKAEYSANGWGDVFVGISVINHTGTYYPKRYPMFEYDSIARWNFQDAVGYNNYQRVIDEFWVDDANEDTEKIFILPSIPIQPPAWQTPFRRVDDALFHISGLEEHAKLVMDGAGADYHPNAFGHRALGIQMYAWVKYTLSLM